MVGFALLTTGDRPGSCSCHVIHPPTGFCPRRILSISSVFYFLFLLSAMCFSCFVFSSFCFLLCVFRILCLLVSVFCYVFFVFCVFCFLLSVFYLISSVFYFFKKTHAFCIFCFFLRVELARTYEVLRDPHKREIYDEYGENAGKEGMGGSGAKMHEPFVLFQSFFGRAFGGGGSSRGRRPRRDEDVIHPLKVSREHLFNGHQRSSCFHVT